MKRSVAFAFVLVAACSKSSTSTSTSTSTPTATSTSSSTSASTATAAPTTSATSTALPWTACAEPRTLTQLGTLKDRAHFEGELLVSSKGAFDPETLAPKEKPGTQTKPAPGVTPSRYKQIAAGKGLIWNDEDHATVEDASTHKVILTAPVCSAGGSIEFELSVTGRFLECVSSRAGTELWDLDAPHPDANKPVLVGKDMAVDPGLLLAPNDSYALSKPTLGFGTEQPTRPDVAWIDLKGHTKKLVDPAPIAMPDDQGNFPASPLPFGFAFCGDAGATFVVAEAKDLAVYRGSDAQKLASVPSMQGGDVSFSASGHYVSQTRGNATTVYRLDR